MPAHSELSCPHDCINCGEHQDNPSDKMIVGLESADGLLTVLETWAICADCKSGNQASLSRIVGLALS